MIVDDDPGRGWSGIRFRVAALAVLMSGGIILDVLLLTGGAANAPPAKRNEMPSLPTTSNVLTRVLPIITDAGSSHVKVSIITASIRSYAPSS